MQRLRTDSQRHHPQGLEILLGVRTSPLQPVDMPLGFEKLATETLSGYCPSHLRKDAPQKMVQKGILGKCCQWRSQLHQRKVLNGSLTETTCSGVDVARSCLAAEPPRLSVEQGCAIKVDIQRSCQLTLPSSCRWRPNYAGNIVPALQCLPAVPIRILQSAAAVSCASDQMAHPVTL